MAQISDITSGVAKGGPAGCAHAHPSGIGNVNRKHINILYNGIVKHSIKTVRLLCYSNRAVEYIGVCPPNGTSLTTPLDITYSYIYTCIACTILMIVDLIAYNIHIAEFIS